MKKIFGLLHLLFAAIIGLFLFLNAVPFSFAVIGCVYLIGKGIIFGLSKRIILSFLDAIAGMILLLAVTGLFSNLILNAIVIIFLIQKGAAYFLRG
ncbi:MAG: hypothetical protein HYW25_01890 [Candidatus Aenigmarchaeota archaeon]|nr:hypothetical protein [Candidatus Aenigmarchaeota archaeon]